MARTSRICAFLYHRDNRENRSLLQTAAGRSANGIRSDRRPVKLQPFTGFYR